MSIAIRHGDCREILHTMPDQSVHCCVTSPPYWGLRDYGVAGQLGMESSLGEYIDVMVEVFREVRRVLRDDATLWLNLGDSYATSINGRSAADTRALGQDDRTFRDKPFSTIGPIFRAGNPDKNGGRSNRDGLAVDVGSMLKPKDLCGIPWRVAFALQADGWYLRQDIIWSKPNPMPESVTDRCTKAHEYIFLMSKSARYFYDAAAIAEPNAEMDRPQSEARRLQRMSRNVASVNGKGQSSKGIDGGLIEASHVMQTGMTRNKRSVWEVATQPFSEAHFATFPPDLIKHCIKSGTSEKGCCAKCGAPWKREIEREERPNASPNCISQYPGYRGISGGVGNDRRNVKFCGWQLSCACDAAVVPCTVLDPFGGAGTTAMVADRLGRNAILIELNPEYAVMAEQRFRNDAGMFAEVVT